MRSNIKQKQYLKEGTPVRRRMKKTRIVVKHMTLIDKDGIGI